MLFFVLDYHGCGRLQHRRTSCVFNKFQSYDNIAESWGVGGLKKKDTQHKSTFFYTTPCNVHDTLTHINIPNWHSPDCPPVVVIVGDWTVWTVLLL